MKKIFIFDLDDTIIECQVNYCRVLAKFCFRLIEAFDYLTPSPKDILIKQNETDLELMKKPFVKERFPTSLILTYRRFHREIYGNEEYDQKVEKDVFNIGMSVFDIIPKPLPKAIETLARLKKKGNILYLYSLGDKEVQMNKIKDNGLDKIFDKDHIFITRKKSIDELDKIYKAILKKYGYVSKDNIIMIGDSLKTDIIPALEFGIKAIKIKANNWTNTYTDEYRYVEVQNIEHAIETINKEKHQYDEYVVMG